MRPGTPRPSKSSWRKRATRSGHSAKNWPGAGLSIKGKKVVDASVFSGVVVMVIVTTMVTPPFLKWSLACGEKKKATTAAP